MRDIIRLKKSFHVTIEMRRKPIIFAHFLNEQEGRLHSLQHEKKSSCEVSTVTYFLSCHKFKDKESTVVRT